MLSTSRLLALSTAALASLSLALTFQVRTLKEQTLLAGRQIREPFRGMYVPEIALPTVTGDTLVVGGGMEEGERQLILAFTTTCQFCLASLPAWRALAEAAAEDTSLHVTTVGMAMDSLLKVREYATKHGLAMPIALAEGRTPYLFRTHRVPAILVLNDEGRVLYSRLGPLTTPDAIDSVRAALRHRLIPIPVADTSTT